MGNLGVSVLVFLCGARGAGVGVFGMGLSELVAPFLSSTIYVAIPTCSRTSNIVNLFSSCV